MKNSIIPNSCWASVSRLWISTNSTYYGQETDKNDFEILCLLNFCSLSSWYLGTQAINKKSWSSCVTKLKETRRTPPRETEQQIFLDDALWKPELGSSLQHVRKRPHLRTSAYAGIPYWLLCQGCRRCLEICCIKLTTQSQYQTASSWKGKFVAFHQSEALT